MPNTKKNPSRTRKSCWVIRIALANPICTTIPKYGSHRLVWKMPNKACLYAPASLCRQHANWQQICLPKWSHLDNCPGVRTASSGAQCLRLLRTAHSHLMTGWLSASRKTFGLLSCQRTARRWQRSLRLMAFN